MPRNHRMFRPSLKTDFRLGLGLILLVVTFGSIRPAQGATVPFTFDITYDAFLNGAPSPTNLVVLGMTSGVGTFQPFGTAIWSAIGTVNFAALPSGDLGISTVSLNFTASFNGGADTISGTDFHVFGVSETLTVQGGTGVFTGASGSFPATAMTLPSSGNTAPNYAGTINSSGEGQISAPGLTAVPEPSTSALLGLAFTGLTGLKWAFRKIRRQY